MKKLKALQKHLLDSALDIPAENLMVFATKGVISSSSGEENNHFFYRYTANIIIIKSTYQLSEITFVLLKWLHQHHPFSDADILEFKADIVDSSSTDIHFTVQLSEVIRCSPQDGGVALIADDAPDMNQIMAQGLGMKASINA